MYFFYDIELSTVDFFRSYDNIERFIDWVKM